MAMLGLDWQVNTPRSKTELLNCRYIHGTVLEDGLLDLHLQSPLNQLSILPLNEEEERDIR